jgi:DNA-directed RNA polymerase I, II, and III subunit RPABC4
VNFDASKKGKRGRLGAPLEIYFFSLDSNTWCTDHSSTIPQISSTLTVASMSREAYQVPIAVPTPGRDSFQTGISVEGPAINYLCGDCNAKVPLKRGDPIRCKECGHRVLYKERTKR